MTRSAFSLAVAVGLFALTSRRAPMEVPAFTAYIAPDPEGASVTIDSGVTDWRTPATTIRWYGLFHLTGRIRAGLAVRVPHGDSLPLELTIGKRTRSVTARDADTNLTFGEYPIDDTGYVRIEVRPLRPATSGMAIRALLLDGAPAAGAHFNLKPRRNAASVHLFFPTDSGAPIAGFYTEVTAVTDPVTTYYMATGFSRGYFGMQVNSPTERRIIFSVWDAANGSSAQDRSTVAAEDQTQLIAKGDGVVASVFGNEGTGGHSHLVYNWKTGSTQRFYVTARPEGSSTIYSGYWFRPDTRRWMLIASFRAPKDGGWLRRLYSFSEDFGDPTGDQLRKAVYGPEWIRLADGSWHELTTATFSCDATGKGDRLDRFMGVDGDHFFLSHGGFVPGYTAFGAPFTRAAAGVPPDIPLP